jgi:hypothetical protein
LLFCHVVRDTAETKLVTYWIDQLHFQAQGLSLQASQQLKDPCLKGAAIELQPRRAWWRRHSISNPVLVTAALIGALSVIENLYGQWFTPPDVVISYSELGALDCLANGPVVVPMNVSSRIQSRSANIVFLKPTLQSDSSPTPQELNVDVNAFEATSLPTLGPGQSVQIKIFAIAPTLDDSQVSPTSYKLSVEAIADAGKFTFSKKITAGNREFRVWPTGLKTPVTRVASYADNTCRFDSSLYLSKTHPQGLHAEITATGLPGQIKDMNVWWPSPPEFEKPPDPTGTTMKIKFITPAFEQFQVFRYQVYLDLSQPANNEVCTNWSSKVIATFQ